MLLLRVKEKQENNCARLQYRAVAVDSLLRYSASPMETKERDEEDMIANSEADAGASSQTLVHRASAVDSALRYLSKETEVCEQGKERV